MIIKSIKLFGKFLPFFRMWKKMLTQLPIVVILLMVASHISCFYIPTYVYLSEA